MLLVLIPIVWAALLMLFAAICRVAADGDGRASHAGPSAISIGEALTLSPPADRSPAPVQRGRRSRPGALRTSRSRRPAHGVR